MTTMTAAAAAAAQVSPEPIINSQILIGGPPGQSLQQPLFALSIVTDPPLAEATPTPVPTPAPTPAPAPEPAMVLSDPHMYVCEGG